MCGRYSFSKLASKKSEIQKLKGADSVPISMNIAPTQVSAVITSDAPDTLQIMSWGLVPHWQKNLNEAKPLINARVEDIVEKPSFRKAIRQQRCIVPADSFYEWRIEGKKRIPYRIFSAHNNLLWMAGIWDIWTDGIIRKSSFSILTTGPNLEMKSIHNRMPIFLNTQNDRNEWLYPHNVDNQVDNYVSKWVTMPDNLLKMYRVTDKLNKNDYAGDDIHNKVAEPLSLF